MENLKVELKPLQESEKEDFITEIQVAFQKAFVEEFGETEEKALPRCDVVESFNAKGAESYNIIHDGEVVGGAVLKINSETQCNELMFFYIKISCHSKGLGLAAWKAIKNLYPATKVWETYTPYFEKRNIHFYVNKCGFKIVEFFNDKHKMPNPPPSRLRENEKVDPAEEFFFKFEKVMN